MSRTYALIGTLILTSLSTAQAQETLPCAGLSATCPLQNDMIPEVNTVFGSAFLDEGSSRVLRRPSTIYGQLDPIRTAAEAAGCTIDSWTGGEYARGRFGLVWDVTEANNLQSGSGTLPGGGRIVGTYNDGAMTGSIGMPHSIFDRQGRVYAARGDGFTAGRYIRKKGRTGVFVAMNGSCPVGTDSARVLNFLYQGGLTPFFAPEAATTPCAELLAGDPGLPSGMYNVDVDGAGGLAPFDVYCDMTTQGGGWTLYAYHEDLIDTVVAVETVEPNVLGVMQAPRWQALRDRMSDGMMFVDEGGLVSRISAATLNAGNCYTPSDVSDLSDIQHTTTTYGSVWHHENSGCTIQGTDYSVIALADASWSNYAINGAALIRRSSAVFDVWPYGTALSSTFSQDTLNYYIK